MKLYIKAAEGMLPIDEFNSWEDWYRSDDCESVIQDFYRIMKNKLEKRYPNASRIYNESLGGKDINYKIDVWTVIIEKQPLYTSFDAKDEIQCMFREGAEYCADKYFNIFVKKAKGAYEDEYEGLEDNEVEYNNDMDFYEWYNSKFDEYGYEFLNKVESILQEKYPGCEFDEEPSVQGFQGGDFWWLTYQDDEYSIEFDWNTEITNIYKYGPMEAAKDYANRFIKAIDSGEALEEE